VHEASGPVPPVGEVDAHGIAWHRKFLDAQPPLHQAQDFLGSEIVRSPGTHIATGADFRGAASRLAHGLDLFAIEAVEFGVRVASEQPLSRRQLHGV
jgi:hypothetical protein